MAAIDTKNNDTTWVMRLSARFSTMHYFHQLKKQNNLTPHPTPANFICQADGALNRMNMVGYFVNLFGFIVV